MSPASPAGQANGAKQARTAPAGSVSAGKVLADGRTVFRSSGALAFFWVWVAIGVFALGDLAVQGHNRGAVAPALIIVVITALMYACCLRPRVEADSEGITVLNPLRDYRAPWGAINGVYLGDSVEFQCTRQPPKGGEKTVYCWALYSSRRSRVRASIRSDPRRRKGVLGGNQRTPGSAGFGQTAGQAGYGRMPAEAQDALAKGATEAIAAELGRKLKEAQASDKFGGCVTGSWAWAPIAGILVSAAVLALVVLL